MTPNRSPLSTTSIKWRATHSVPVFAGPQSRRHVDVPLWRLAIETLPARLLRPRRFAQVEVFLQFAGFPRSGHSLLGALVDAHPEAVVSHELDTMGLAHKGLTRSMLFALIVANAQRFRAAGRWWNGYAYDVPGSPRRPASQPRLVGDKKGDWAVRWASRDLDLVRRVRDEVGVRCRWVLVTRHPLDNIATMSLRHGRHYDNLRIEAANSAAFQTALVAAQHDGRIAASALDTMIDDYEELCCGASRLRANVDDAEWLEIGYETFVAAPQEELQRLLAFLDLPSDPDYLARAVSIVAPTAHASRERVHWTPAQLERVAGIIERYDFLHRYATVRNDVA